MAQIADAISTLVSAAEDYLEAAERVADALSELGDVDLDEIKDDEVRGVVARTLSQVEALEPDRTPAQELVDLSSFGGYDIEAACE
jgi:hypothetical protein